MVNVKVTTGYPAAPPGTELAATPTFTTDTSGYLQATRCRLQAGNASAASEAAVDVRYIVFGTTNVHARACSAPPCP